MEDLKQARVENHQELEANFKKMGIEPVTPYQGQMYADSTPDHYLHHGYPGYHGHDHQYNHRGYGKGHHPYYGGVIPPPPFHVAPAY